MEYAVEAGRGAPPLLVTSISVAGVGLQDWVYILTAIYTVLQIAIIVRKYVKDRRNGSN